VSAHRAFDHIRSRRGEDGRARQGGFTLIELIVCLALLAIIMIPLTAAFIQAIQQTRTVDDRLAQTTDSERIAAAWTHDVRSVSATGYDTDGYCQDPTGVAPAETFLASFEWGGDPSAGALIKKASWMIEVTGPSAQLVRRYCEGGKPIDEQLIADSFGVANRQNLDSVHSTYGTLSAVGLKDATDVCTSTTCTIVMDGTYQYQLTVTRGVPGNDTGTVILPPAPVITGSTCGNGTITVAWSPSASPTSAPISNYKVVVTNSNGDTVNGNGNGDVVSGTSTSAQVDGLQNGVQFYVQVQAGISGQYGPLSQPPFPVMPCATAPGPPQNVDSTRGDGQLTVRWTAPADNGGATITSYRIRARIRRRPSSSPTRRSPP